MSRTFRKLNSNPKTCCTKSQQNSLPVRRPSRITTRPRSMKRPPVFIERILLVEMPPIVVTMETGTPIPSLSRVPTSILLFVSPPIPLIPGPRWTPILVAVSRGGWCRNRCRRCRCRSWCRCCYLNLIPGRLNPTHSRCTLIPPGVDIDITRCTPTRNLTLVHNRSNPTRVPVSDYRSGNPCLIWTDPWNRWLRNPTRDRDLTDPGRVHGPGYLRALNHWPPSHSRVRPSPHHVRIHRHCPPIYILRLLWRLLHIRSHRKRKLRRCRHGLRQKVSGRVLNHRGTTAPLVIHHRLHHVNRRVRL